LTLERLEAAWDRPSVDLEALSEILAEEATAPAAEAVLARVPTGLVHADTITIERTRPPGFDALGAGSAWAASGRDLVVRVDHDPSEVLADLARYFALARAVAERLGRRAPLASRLRRGALEPADRPELCERLQLDGVALQRLEAKGWLSDLGWMAARGFAPRVRVASELRPSAARARGAAAGDALAARLPQEGMPLLALEDPIGLDLFSPYPRDLGHALHAWGIENAGRLRTEGLAEALRLAGRNPDEDLASLVAAELAAVEPERGLLEERRAAERGQGLRLEDAFGLTFGLAELGALAAPDPQLPSSSEVLALAAGPSRAGVAEAVGVLLDSGRIDRLGVVGGIAVGGWAPVIPEAMVTPRDGFALPGAAELRELAAARGVEARDVAVLELARGAWVAEAVGRARREMVRGRAPADLALYGLFHPAESVDASPTVQGGRAALDAARVVAAALLLPRKTPADSAKVGVNTYKNRPLGRRFRA
jgi:hypothetical protein